LDHYTSTGKHTSNTPQKGQNQRAEEKPVKEQKTPLIGQNWTELLKLVKVVAAIEASHQLQEHNNDVQSPINGTEAIAPKLADTTGAPAPTGSGPTGTAAGQAGPSPDPSQGTATEPGGER
jgi:hypothetical protein